MQVPLVGWGFVAAVLQVKCCWSCRCSAAGALGEILLENSPPGAVVLLQLKCCSRCNAAAAAASWCSSSFYAAAAAKMLLQLQLQVQCWSYS